MIWVFHRLIQISILLLRFYDPLGILRLLQYDLLVSQLMGHHLL